MGAVANKGPSLTNAAYSEPFVGFRATSVSHIRTLEDYASDNSGTSTGWLASLKDVPTTNCSTDKFQVGSLPPLMFGFQHQRRQRTTEPRHCRQCERSSLHPRPHPGQHQQAGEQPRL
jgi:hypothetical protein